MGGCEVTPERGEGAIAGLWSKELLGILATGVGGGEALGLDLRVEREGEWGVSAHVAGTSCDPGHLGDHPILFFLFLFAVFTEIPRIASWVVSKQRNHFSPTQACEVIGMLTVYTGHTFHG